MTCKTGKVLQHWRKSRSIKSYVSSFILIELKSVPLPLFRLGPRPQSHSLQQSIHFSSHLIHCLIRAALGKLCFLVSLFLWCLMTLVADHGSAQSIQRGWALLVMRGRFKVKVSFAGAFLLSSEVSDLDANTKLCPRLHHSHRSHFLSWCWWLASGCLIWKSNMKVTEEDNAVLLIEHMDKGITKKLNLLCWGCNKSGFCVQLASTTSECYSIR